MKKTATALILMILFALSVTPALGAGSLDTLEVQVWPEYDKPSVLIMYAGKIKKADNITVYFPKGTEVFKVLNKITSDDSAKQKYTTKDEDGLLATTFDLPNDSFFAEGYWDVLGDRTGKREFTLKYKVPMDTGKIDLFIQKPAGAKDFSVTPQPSQFVTDKESKLESAHFGFENKKQGEVVEFKVSYSKSDSTLSVQQTPSGDTSKSSGADVKTVGLVLLSLALFVVGGFFFYAYKNNGLPSKVRPAQIKSKAPKPGKVNFCPNCGTKAEGRFCGNCGQKLDG